MQHFVATYGYLAVFALMILESACVPVPSELLMMFGGALAAGAVAGASLSLPWVIVAGVAGNVVGGYVAWFVGRYAGLAALRRWGRYVWIREHDIDRAQRWFDHRGAISVLVGRVIPVVRTFISLPAGVVGLHPVRFGLYTLAGSIPWIGGLAVAGFAIGGKWRAVEAGFRTPTYVIAAILAVAIVVAVVLFVRRRRAARPAPEREPQRRG